MTRIDLDTDADISLLGGDDAETVVVDKAEVKDDEKTTEVKVEPAPELKTDGGDKDDEGHQSIPRARFNEVNAKFKAEAERSAALEAALVAERAKNTTPAPKDKEETVIVPAVDVDALESKYADLLMEGDTAAALKVRKEINAELLNGVEEKATTRVRDEIKAREQEAAEKAANDALEADKTTLAEAAAKIKSTFPFLDDKSAEANTEAIDAVIAMRNHFKDKGDPMSSALIKAVNLVAPSYTKKPGTVTPIEDKRKKEAIARNIKDAEKQGVALDASGMGNRLAPTLNVPTQQVDYEKLPEAQRIDLLGG